MEWMTIGDGLFWMNFIGYLNKSGFAASQRAFTFYSTMLFWVWPMEKCSICVKRNYVHCIHSQILIFDFSDFFSLVVSCLSGHFVLQTLAAAMCVVPSNSHVRLFFIEPVLLLQVMQVNCDSKHLSWKLTTSANNAVKCFSFTIRFHPTCTKCIHYFDEFNLLRRVELKENGPNVEMRTVAKIWSKNSNSFAGKEENVFPTHSYGRTS